MEEEKQAETIKSRTKKQQYILYARRFIAFVFYVAIQAASWYLIILLTTQSSEIQLQIADKLISLLTAIEKWDDVGFAIKAMVTRLYLAKILNMLIQMFSFALLLDPFLLTSTQNILNVIAFDGSTVRNNVMLGFKSDVYSCRAEQALAGLLTLVVTDFSVSKVMAISAPCVGVVAKLFKRIWRRRREKLRRSKPKTGSKVLPDSDGISEVAEEESLVHNDTDILQISTKETSTSQEISPISESLVTKAEFLVPLKMVALLYSCTIALVAIPLAPTTALLALVLHIANFKFDRFILMHLQKKPANPWGAKDADSFFIKFYFCTVLIFLSFTCPIRDFQSNVTSKIPATLHYACQTATTPLKRTVQSTQLAHRYDTHC
ncbi:hypothetical protein GN958_ATG23141 [Phytophthora infestans]|uniref:Transmembrane protein n=1 Tax=Phytophthora infestans TaxID=4787 RepID=A0A8S9TGN5_PHYIN|nr:hypothetical protein GN958_ATG23141 [Phytophthora infestans]